MRTDVLLKIKRIEKSLKQAEVAEKLGLSLTIYNKIENGRIPIVDLRIKTVKILADTLNLSEDEIKQLIKGQE